MRLKRPGPAFIINFQNVHMCIWTIKYSDVTEGVYMCEPTTMCARVWRRERARKREREMDSHVHIYRGRQTEKRAVDVVETGGCETWQIWAWVFINYLTSAGYTHNAYRHSLIKIVKPFRISFTSTFLVSVRPCEREEKNLRPFGNFEKFDCDVVFFFLIDGVFHLVR